MRSIIDVNGPRPHCPVAPLERLPHVFASPDIPARPRHIPRRSRINFQPSVARGLRWGGNIGEPARLSDERSLRLRRQSSIDR